MNACDMVNLCMRRQMPELYGGQAVSDAIVPTELRYGPDGNDIAVTLSHALPDMGNPEARALPDSSQTEVLRREIDPGYQEPPIPAYSAYDFEG